MPYCSTTAWLVAVTTEYIPHLPQPLEITLASTNKCKLQVRRVMLFPLLDNNTDVPEKVCDPSTSTENIIIMPYLRALIR